MEKHTPLKFCLEPRAEMGGHMEKAAFLPMDARTSKLYLLAEVKVLVAERGKEGGISTAVMPIG